MTDTPWRKRWMEPGAPPYVPPPQPRTFNPGRAAGIILVTPILVLFTTAMISNGDIGGWDIGGGVLLTALLMVLIVPSKTRKR